MNYIRLLTPLALILAVAATVVLGPYMGAVTIIGLVLGVFFLGHPPAILACYLLLAAVQPLLQMYGFPVGYLDELLVVFMIVLLGGQIALRGALPHQLKPFYVLTFAAMLVVGISLLVNQSPLIQAVHFVSTYFRFIPVFILAYMYWNSSGKAYRLAKASAVFIVVQLVLSAAWLLGINPLPNPKSWYDAAIGTLASCAHVAYYAIGFIAVTLSWINSERNIGAAMRPIFWTFVGVVLLLLTLTIHAYLLGVFLCGWWILRELRHRGASLLFLGGIMAAAAVCVVLFFFSAQGFESNMRHSMSPSYLMKRAHQARYEPKGIVYENVLRHAPRDLKMPAVGAGPGNFASLVGVTYNAPLARKYVTYFFSSYSARVMMQSGSITVYPYAGLLSIYGDIGPIGVAVFYGFYLLAFVRIYRQLSEGAYREKWRLIAAHAFIPVCLVWMTISLVWDAFHIDYLCSMVWLLAAIAWTPSVGDQSKDGEENGDVLQEVRV